MEDRAELSSLKLQAWMSDLHVIMATGQCFEHLFLIFSISLLSSPKSFLKPQSTSLFRLTFLSPGTPEAVRQDLP